MKPLLVLGEIKPSLYAYLYDRVAVGAERPQRFGTQGRCVGTGRWEPQPIEEPELVDIRRAQMGLVVLQDYIELMNGHCSE
jgi:hypothetical protein